MSDNLWKTVSENLVFQTPIMDIYSLDCVCRTKQHRFYVLRSPDWCNIIPITSEGKVVMVRQGRIGINQETLEIPGGVVDPGDMNLEEAARRELLEETGYEGVGGARCRYLGWSYPNPAILNNKVHSFVLGPVEKKREQKLDSGEMMNVIEVPIEEIPDLIEKNVISHALIMNAFQLLARTSETWKSSIKISLNEALGRVR